MINDPSAGVGLVGLVFLRLHCILAPFQMPDKYGNIRSNVDIIKQTKNAAHLKCFTLFCNKFLVSLESNKSINTSKLFTL